MYGLAESGSNPTQAILILANTVRIYLQIRAGAVSTSSGFYGYLNTQQRICNPSAAITLTWMEFSNNASFLKDTFQQGILSGFTKGDTYLHPFYKLGNQCTQRSISTKWKAVVQTGINTSQSEPDVLFSSALGELWRVIQEWCHGFCLHIYHKTHYTHNNFILYVIWVHLCHQELFFNQKLWMYFIYFSSKSVSCGRKQHLWL